MAQLKMGQFAFRVRSNGIPVRPGEIIDFLSQSLNVDIRQLLSAQGERTNRGSITFQLYDDMGNGVDYFLSPDVLQMSDTQGMVSVFCVREPSITVAVGVCPQAPPPPEKSKASVVTQGVLSVPAAVFNQVTGTILRLGGTMEAAAGIVTGIGALTGPAIAPMSVLSALLLVTSGALSWYTGGRARRWGKRHWARVAHAARDLGMRISLTHYPDLTPAANWVGRAQIIRDTFHVQGVVSDRERTVGVQYPDAIFVSGAISDLFKLLIQDFSDRSETRVFLYSPVTGETWEYWKNGERVHRDHLIKDIATYSLASVRLETGHQQQQVSPEISEYLQQIGQPVEA